MNYEIQSRVKSFGWRLGGMVAAAVIAFAIENATEFQIPVWGVALLGLLNGEITKYLNSRS
jgi:hypothetical protein